jgi:hypothetical protein
MSVQWWAVPTGVVALATIEVLALVLGRRYGHPTGVPLSTRVARLGAVVALGGGTAAVIVLLVSLPIDDAIGLAAAGAAAVALVAVGLLRLARSIAFDSGQS